MIGLSNRFLLSISLVVSGVGVLDSFIGGQWDLLLVFALSITLQLVLWFRQRANRVPVTLRPDLSHWIENRSQRTGEAFDDVLDRSVAWYQHGLFADDESR